VSGSVRHMHGALPGSQDYAAFGRMMGEHPNGEEQPGAIGKQRRTTFPGAVSNLSQALVGM
jgi:hypothetical protein